LYSVTGAATGAGSFLCLFFKNRNTRPRINATPAKGPTTAPAIPAPWRPLLLDGGGATLELDVVDEVVRELVDCPDDDGPVVAVVVVPIGNQNTDEIYDVMKATYSQSWQWPVEFYTLSNLEKKFRNGTANHPPVLRQTLRLQCLLHMC
jgi:hypothetical protein